MSQTQDKMDLILEAAFAAGEGAAQRAANRGWSLQEQERCRMEATDAEFLALVEEARAA